VEEVNYQLGMTISEDENDLKVVEEYWYLAQRDCQPDGPPPRGYSVPIGTFFKKEEEVKAYHMMFSHIIGEDGLCVYPHCRKPISDSDSDRALFFIERYFGCFQDNFDELERTRLELQDLEYDRVTMARKTQKPKTPVPPDPIVPPIPLRPPKKNRRSKQDKRRANAVPAASSLNSQIAELRCILLTTHVTDSFSNEVIELQSVSMSPTTAPPLQVLGPVPNLVLPITSRVASNLSSFPSDVYDYDDDVNDDDDSDDCESEDIYM
jgi:hypothetical protein